MDLIGTPVFTNDYVVAGTCTENLNGMCESMWRPDMGPDELSETLSQCLLAAVGRDAVVHVITPTGVQRKMLKCRKRKAETSLTYSDDAPQRDIR